MKYLYAGFVKKGFGDLVDTYDTMCPLVYNGIATDPSGGVRPCCIFNQKYNFRGDVKDYRSSKIYKEIESAFLAGGYHPGCHHCERLDKNGASSKRTREISNYLGKYKKQEVDWDHLKTVGYDLIDLRLSNKCNLSCITCNPKSSSMIYDETKKNKDSTMFHYSNIYDLAGKIKNIDLTNPYDDANIDQLLDCINETSRLYFTGGEPSIVKGVFRILRHCIDTGLNKHVRVEFNSNFQTENPKFIDLLSYFPKGLMMPSIDVVGPRAHYVRYPSNWIRIDKNMKKFKEACPDWRFHLAPTVSILTLFYLDEVADYCETNGFELNLSNQLWGPTYFQTSIIPDKWKTIALEKLQTKKNYKCFSKFGPISLGDFDKMYETIRGFIYSEDSDLERLQACRTNLNRIDAIRGVSYKDNLPILKEIFKECL